MFPKKPGNRSIHPSKSFPAWWNTPEKAFHHLPLRWGDGGGVCSGHQVMGVPHFWRDQTWCKCMVILKDFHGFPLIGLVIFCEVCCDELIFFQWPWFLFSRSSWDFSSLEWLPLLKEVLEKAVLSTSIITGIIHAKNTLWQSLSFHDHSPGNCQRRRYLWLVVAWPLRSPSGSETAWDDHISASPKYSHGPFKTLLLWDPALSGFLGP